MFSALVAIASGNGALMLHLASFAAIYSIFLLWQGIHFGCKRSSLQGQCSKSWDIN
jgi:hypothetical protein